MSIFINLPWGIYKLLILRGLEITPAVSFISILTINALSLPFFLRSLMIAFLLITHICLKFQLIYLGMQNCVFWYALSPSILWPEDSMHLWIHYLMINASNCKGKNLQEWNSTVLSSFISTCNIWLISNVCMTTTIHPNLVYINLNLNRLKNHKSLPISKL